MPSISELKSESISESKALYLWEDFLWIIFPFLSMWFASYRIWGTGIANIYSHLCV